MIAPRRLTGQSEQPSYDCVACVATRLSLARQVLSEWGVAGYRDKWVDRDFPLAELQTLERAAASRAWVGLRGRHVLSRHGRAG